MLRRGRLCRRAGRKVFAPADAFDIFPVMFTENPAVFDKKLLLSVTLSRNVPVPKCNNASLARERLE
jgi:hypothetical protein